MKLRLPLLTVLLMSTWVQAHPEPDIPVRTYFSTEGKCTLTVEVDPRCFTTNPTTAPSLMQPVLPSLSSERVAQLKKDAQVLVDKYIEFLFDPAGAVHPEFSFEFTGMNRAPLDSEDDIVVLTGTCEMPVPAGSTAWRIHATKATPLAIVFRNYLADIEHPKFSVLFPGETSFAFDLKPLNLPAAGSRP